MFANSGYSIIQLPGLLLFVSKTIKKHIRRNENENGPTSNQIDDTEQRNVDSTIVFIPHEELSGRIVSGTCTNSTEVLKVSQSMQ